MYSQIQQIVINDILADFDYAGLQDGAYVYVARDVQDGKLYMGTSRYPERRVDEINKATSKQLHVIITTHKST